MPRTENDLKKLEKRLKLLYQKTADSIEIEIDHYVNGWDEVVLGEVVHHKGMFERREEQFKAFQEGKYTEEEFNKWWAAQEGRLEHWTSLRDQVAEKMANTNEDACRMINKLLPSTYANASNSIAIEARREAERQMVKGINFELVDEHTIQRLMKKPDARLPFYMAQNDTVKDIRWNTTKLQNELIVGLEKGESAYQIATRLQSVKTMGRSTAIRNARTTITSARNAGKQDRYNDLAKQGVDITKVWNAELDERVREEHEMADGQEVPYNEPFEVGGERLMYPGDISLGAHGWNVLNCRCAMKTGHYKFHSVLTEEQRRSANIKVIG